MKVGTKRDALRPLARMAIFITMWLFGFGGAAGGFAIGFHFFKRNDTLQIVLAGVGIVVGVLLWWPLRRYLSKWT